METTIPQVLASAVRRDPASPLLTFYDDLSGDRTELSGATLDNWVSKTANLLVDGLGLSSGDTAAVALPPHWQTAAILLGVWSAGVTAEISVPKSADVLFTTPDSSTTTKAPDRYATGLLPFAMPLRELPAGFADYVLEVRQFGDHFPGAPVAAGDRALNDRTHAEVITDAQARATELGIGPGSRVLVDTTTRFDPIDWLVTPLVAGASVVLCANLDPARTTGRVESEKVTLVVA